MRRSVANVSGRYTYGPNGALASVVGQDTYVQAATYDIAGRLDLLGLGLSGGQPVLNVDYVYNP